MNPTESLLLDFSLDSRGRSNIVRLRVFSNEEEMYVSGGPAGGTRDAYTVTCPSELFSPTSGGMAQRRDKQREAPTDPGFAQYAGKALWEALPDPVRATLASPRNAPLCVKFTSIIRSVLELPWEWLDDGAGPLAFRDQLRIVRSVPVRFFPPPAVVQVPLRVLFVVSNPKDERLLYVPTEIAALSQSLNTNFYQWSVLDKPTLAALAEELERTTPHIVHYVGHAGVSANDGNIILHEGDVSHWVDSSTLSHVVPSSVRLLCLSTCFTARNYQIAGLERLAEAPAFTTLPTCIVNRFPLQEEAVRAFWSSFYDQLIVEEGNVLDVFHAARRNVATANPVSADWSSFALVIRDNQGRCFQISNEEADDPKRLAARAIRAQFKAEVMNQLAEQMKVIGADASNEVVERLQRSIERVDKYTSTSEE
jgi:hypothetical protein